VALDARDPIDVAALKRNPAFASAEMEARPEGLVVMLPIAAHLVPRLRRDARAFVISFQEAAEGTSPGLEPKSDSGGARLLMPLHQAGRVVPVQDPMTGLPLLLATTARPDQAVSVERRLPELDLLPTVLGIAVLARSDRVSLRAAGENIAIGLGNDRMALDPDVGSAPPAPEMSRSFAFPKQQVPPLLERLKSLQTSIVNAPPLARMPERQAAAEVMLALGMPQEAQALLGIGFTEDPRAGREPLYRALSSIAALLSGRSGEASGLSLSSLPDTDEIRFWRAVLAAELGDAKAAAPGMRTTLPLLVAYPQALQRRLLPIVGQALADAGDREGLRALLQAVPDDPGLALPRAILEELDGRGDAALAAFAEIARNSDRLPRARALRRAAELRLATGLLSPLAAAAELEKSLFAWRGPDEVVLRLRIAELLLQGGAARRAFALLQESAGLFPEQTSQLRPALTDAFVASLETESPLAAIALYDANAQLLPFTARGDEALAVLAERLAELDLAERATALLRPLLARTTGERRAVLGLRLAKLRLQEGDLADAKQILGDTAIADLPAAIALERALLAARIAGRRGRHDEGVAMLRGFGPPAAEAIAELLTESRDWSGAAASLAARRAAQPATATPLSEADQRLVVREATLLALAGDQPGLIALAQAMTGRLSHEALSRAFLQMVNTPLQGLANLPRLQRDLHIFQRLPDGAAAARKD